MSQIKLLHSGGNGVILSAPTSNPASDTTFKLPQADGSANEVLKTDGSGNLSFVAQPTGGLAVAQEWAYGSYPVYYSTTTDLNGTWNATAASVGSAMTVSSGVFTFPSTGIYKVFSSNTSVRISNESRVFSIFTYLSTDSGSNFTLQRETYGNINNDASSSTTFTNTVILDITNTSTHKVKFAVTSETQISLSTTYVHFLKLGDT